MPPAAATSASSDWGTPHRLFHGPVEQTLSQVTSSVGTTVIVFVANARNSPAHTYVAVQPSGEPWTPPIPLSDSAALRPTAIAWGAGNVSVVWQTSAGQDDWTFHLRTLDPTGSWRPEERLVTARYAYPWYRADINERGQVALCWSNGDGRDRVAERDVDGSWSRSRPAPVVHPTFQGTPFIANPLDVFVDAGGRVSDVSWGTIGHSGRAVWLLWLAADGSWSQVRVAPIRGAHLGYDWVPEAQFASDADGNVSAVWPQQDPASGQWSLLFRNFLRSAQPRPVYLLSHYRCDYFDQSCADVGVTADGSVLASWASPVSGHNVVVKAFRQPAGGAPGVAQRISDRVWANQYTGVRLVNNQRGDLLVTFNGGDRSISYTEFARCTAGDRCGHAQVLTNHPSWLDHRAVSIGPAGGSTVAWVTVRKKAVFARHLAPMG